jgi:hypothetical protein
MKLIFKGTEGFESYHAKIGNWQDGDEKDVPEEIAKELLKSFPKNFFKPINYRVEGKDFEGKGMSPKNDKSLKPEHNK